MILNKQASKTVDRTYSLKKCSMKKLFLRSLAFLVLSFSFYSCSQDELKLEETPKGSFNLFLHDRIVLDLYQGFMTNLGENPNASGLYSHQLILASHSVHYDTQTQLISGEGDVVEFKLSANNNTGIQPGTYHFNNTDASYNLEAGLIYSISKNNPSLNDSGLVVTDGSITISKNEESYTLDCKLTVKAHHNFFGTVEGNYTGAF